jgi:Flp pilus assembly protein TadD
MATFEDRDLYAGTIYQADQIHVHQSAPDVDHVAAAMAALRARNYASARKGLDAAVDRRPDDPELNYYLGLSLLAGRRPHLHGAASIDKIAAHLDIAARTLTEATALLLLVKEDYTTAWRNHSAVPREVMDLVSKVSPDRAKEITEHVRAPESRVWKLLAMRAERNLT